MLTFDPLYFLHRLGEKTNDCHLVLAPLESHWARGPLTDRLKRGGVKVRPSCPCAASGADGGRAVSLREAAVSSS